MSATQTVFVVDDEAVIRKALKLMLELAGHRVQPFASAQEFLDGYDPSMPGCLILDVRMPGMDGMELLRHLTKQEILIPIIMLTAHGDIPMAVDAMKTGAVEFLEKPAQPNMVREKVLAALAQDQEWRLDEEERAEIRENYRKLTPREREVLELLIDGKKARTVGRILGTSQNTIRVQRSSIMKKMRADSPADLVKMMALLRPGKSD